MDIFTIDTSRKFLLCVKNYNFDVNPLGRSEGTYNKYASLDDATDPLHYYLSYIKFELVELHQMQLMRLEMVTLPGKREFS